MSIALIERANSFRSRRAIAAASGVFTYQQLLQASARVAAALLGADRELEGRRVAFLVTPSFDHVAVQWGVWRAGGVAVPLCLQHPRPELDYVVRDCDADFLVASPKLAERLRPIAAEQRRKLLLTGALLDHPEASLPDVEADRPAMIVYTSGTTGSPKGVVTTHDNIRAQIGSLIEAWQWSPEDRILLALPLHHVHGIINVVGCALWAGALCEMLPRFDAVEVWNRLGRGELTLFMGVPTIYAKLVAAWEAATDERRRAWSAGAGRLRLAVSGSAALPVRLMARWEEITGLTLLERYGMTEIGMALSNPLVGERLAGRVGRALPGVEVRRVDSRGKPVPQDEPGEIEVRGPGVFKEYWGRSEETARAFREGWFRTGDLAVEEGGVYRILGRRSVDIIKTGGYKVSALEVEESLQAYPGVAECAVVGVPDEEWGERVAVAVVAAGQAAISVDELRAWAKERLAAYKVPTRLMVVEELPRNPLGKVIKPELRRWFLEPAAENQGSPRPA